MAINSLITASPQPPPDVPDDPGIGMRLGNYLRQFSLWSRRGFATKLDAGVALPGLLLQESGVAGTPRVYRLTITVSSGTPAIQLTQASLGDGQP